MTPWPLLSTSSRHVPQPLCGLSETGFCLGLQSSSPVSLIFKTQILFLIFCIKFDEKGRIIISGQEEKVEKLSFFIWVQWAG